MSNNKGSHVSDIVARRARTLWARCPAEGGWRRVRRPVGVVMGPRCAVVHAGWRATHFTTLYPRAFSGSPSCRTTECRSQRRRGSHHYARIICAACPSIRHWTTSSAGGITSGPHMCRSIDGHVPVDHTASPARYASRRNGVSLARSVGHHGAMPRHYLPNASHHHRSAPHP